MLRDLPQYREYNKNINDLFPRTPVSWRLMRLKFLMPEVTVGIVITPSKYYVEKGVPAIRSLNVKGGRLVDDDLVYFSDEDNEKLKKTQIYQGDVVIVRSGQTGASAVVDERFDGCNCIDLIIVRKSKRLDSRYLQYLLMSNEVQAQVFTSSNGAIQQHFNISLVRELIALAPPREDQGAIVTFLNKETGKIDQLLSVRRAQIERLREQRTAVIHYAVTKGLIRNTPLRPSEAEWLDEIPSHWRTKKLRFVVNFKGGGTPAKGNSAYWKGEIPWVSPKDMKSFEITEAEDHISQSALADSATSLIEKDSVLMVVRSGILRRCIPVALNSVEVALNQDMKALKPKAELLPQYLMLLIHSNEKLLLTLWRKHGSTVESLEHHLIADTRIPLPPVEEQRDIITYVINETAKIDSLISKYTKELDLLEEYRSSLISHAVTGRIDVRSLTKTPEPELTGAL